MPKPGKVVETCVRKLEGPVRTAAIAGVQPKTIYAWMKAGRVLNLAAGLKMAAALEPDAAERFHLACRLAKLGHIADARVHINLSQYGKRIDFAEPGLCMPARRKWRDLVWTAESERGPVRD